MLMRNGGQGGVVGSSPPFDSSLAEREISYLNSAAEALDWKAPNGSTFSLEIPPTVYPPRRDTDLLAEVLCRGPLNPGVHFLEIGCGSGALSLLAASQGCSVHACDINPMAVACTRALLTSHNVRGEVREGGPGPSEDGDPRQWGVTASTMLLLGICRICPFRKKVRTSGRWKRLRWLIQTR